MRMSDTFSGGRKFLLPIVVPLIIVILFIQAPHISIVHANAIQPMINLQPVFTDPNNLVTQAYFVMNGQSTSHLQNSLRITNSGSATSTISLYPVDAFTAAAGGIAFHTRKEPRVDVGAWIVLAIQQLTLAPGQIEIVPFHLTIPPHTRSGQHLGGIVGEEVNMQSIKTGKNSKSVVHIDLQQLHVVAVQVNLPGPSIEKLVVTSIHSNNANVYQNIQLALRNTGNMMVKSVGSLQIFDLEGHRLQNQIVRLNTFLPQTSINDQIYIQHKALSVGRYKALLQLTYGKHQFLSYTTIITIVEKEKTLASTISALTSLNDNENIFNLLAPWQIAIGAGILLLIICGLTSWVIKLFKLVTNLQNKHKEIKVLSCKESDGKRAYSRGGISKKEGEESQRR